MCVAFNSRIYNNQREIRAHTWQAIHEHTRAISFFSNRRSSPLLIHHQQTLQN